ncbi:lymphocyte antigen 6G-like isoform X1 [Scylla paramamosain]|uniref:lymphocyte antigen 6G-like isoform X1 n=2 Tax=Scylla paramamosain TaxID=85552 RepID=UPI003082FB0C
MMHKMVSLLLVAVMVVVATLPSAESVKCYTCIGYDPAAPENDLSNSPSCPQASLNLSALTITEGTQCKAELRDYKGVKNTQRGPYSGDSTERTRDADFVTLKGYICSTDFCNNQDPNHGAPTTALCLPLFLLSLLTVLPLRLA